MMHSHHHDPISRWPALALLLAASAVAPATVRAAAPAAGLRVDGRRLLDACGKPLVVRGVEQPVGIGMEVPQIGGDWSGLIDQIAATGANAVRLLPDLGQVGLQQVDALVGRAVQHGMVVFWSVYSSGAKVRARDHWARPEVKALVHKWNAWMVVDAFQEPNYDDRARWRREAVEAVRFIRAQGYEVPITVMANQFGRDLPALLEHGAEVAAADPLGRTILGWQAYWGSSNYYQRTYKMTIAEGVAAAARAPFPIQVGLDHRTDPGETADFESAMAAAERHGLGWLWWNYYNPFWRENDLSRDGFRARLTDVGRIVIQDGPASIGRTARKACTRP
jgi:mannan endo-1,4-beta-mannosidase